MKVIKLLHHVIRGAGNCSTFTQTKFITNSKVIKAPWSEKNVIARVVWSAPEFHIRIQGLSK